MTEVFFCAQCGDDSCCIDCCEILHAAPKKEVVITKLSIGLDNSSKPTIISAAFSDGLYLNLTYKPSRGMCFASLSRRKGIETSYRHNLPTEIEIASMTRQDWENVCYQYRSELEVVA